MLCVMNLGESDTDTHCEVGHCISHQTTRCRTHDHEPAATPDRASAHPSRSRGSHKLTPHTRHDTEKTHRSRMTL